jgi:two-component system, NtrC family, response regulator AtoC
VPSPDEHDLDTVLTIAGDSGLEAEESRRGHLHMVLIGNGTLATHPLPESGMLTIGRSATCDITLDDKSISRRHAVLNLGERLTIEDLNSANGTRVRGAAVKFGHPVRIAVGEVVGLGKVSIILQQRSTTRTRKILNSEDFAARLDEECARTQRSGAAFALLHFEPEHKASAGAVEDALCELLRETDLIGKHSLYEYRVLLLDTLASNADDAVRRIANKLIHRGLKCKIQLACYPRDAKQEQPLLPRPEVPAFEPRPSESHATGDVVVVDQQMRSLHQLIEQVAGSHLGVLLLGETGVGKEIFARSVHRSSQRASGPFVELNCAALTETLLESELFGHEKGAFTHATSAKPGLLEIAHGGTLLLDEVCDMPLTTQAKLLRVIEDSQLRRVGGLKQRSIDVRFVAATNIDIEARIESGLFRRDLFYRLNGVTLMIPPLRERIVEVAPLATLFIERAWHRDSRPPRLAPETLELMKSYSWPGNVRELKYTIERAVLVCGQGPILPEHLPDKLRALAGTLQARSPVDVLVEQPTPPPADEHGLDEERRLVEALDRAGGNQTIAARLLGISRRTLVNRLNIHNHIERPRKGKKKLE